MNYNEAEDTIRAQLNQDPDNDGLTTAQELAIGTNPYHWDTDGDLAPDGWDFQPLKDTDWVERSQRLLEIAIAYLNEQQSPTADLETHRLEWDKQQQTLSLTAKGNSEKAWAVSYRSGDWVLNTLQATLSNSDIERLTAQLQKQLENHNVKRMELKL